MTIIEKAPAKINLGLDIINKRSDHYHNLAMIMMSVDLNDYITISEIKGSSEIIIESNTHKLPLNEKNDIYKAVTLIQERYQIKCGVHIYLQKNIPICAGLGGGSSDAAATIRALNQLWSLNMSKQEMYTLGFEIGSDVPYCLESTCSLISGKGEIVKKIDTQLTAWVVLVKPDFGVSTRDIFKEIDCNTISHVDIFSLKTALVSNDWQHALKFMGNSLEDITIPKYPLIQKIKDKMVHSGADMALMTGSGPTVYGLCQTESRANRVVNSMKGFCKEVYKVRIL